MSLGFPQTLAGLQPRVAPHVGAAVRAGDVEQGDTLELGPISQLERLSITLNIKRATVITWLQRWQKLD